MARGPKVEPELGPLKRRQVLLDETTERRLDGLDKNRSRAIRRAARHAYNAMQRGETVK